jgi:Na+/citrate or Na+/malate symporter
MRQRMTYTEEQKAALRTEFAARRKRQLLVSIPLAIFMIGVLVIIDDKSRAPIFGLSPAMVLVAFAVVMVAGLAFSLANWRCPACQRYLGKHINPSFCHRCGAPLR